MDHQFIRVGAEAYLTDSWDVAPTNLPLDVAPPTAEEIWMAIMQIKSGKSEEPDNITAEALKSNIEVTVNMLYILFMMIWKEEQLPLTDWKEGYLSNILKKGDLTKCEDYGGIIQLSVPGKVFGRVLLNQMKDSVDAKHRDQQAGFRKDRPCTGQIATLRIIVERSIASNPSL
ncbi:unnamed protein product [Schistosoma curassoni]|uniref:Reverse transcriptase domain-containing protein n=1 Tax=Schistosoma curassoni TaxID=6186 RepID=A0A183KUX0_9TREM|nr:unnamed protein product [Schistosoma curassoni]